MAHNRALTRRRRTTVHTATTSRFDAVGRREAQFAVTMAEIVAHLREEEGEEENEEEEIFARGEPLTPFPLHSQFLNLFSRAAGTQVELRQACKGGLGSDRSAAEIPGRTHPAAAASGAVRHHAWIAAVGAEIRDHCVAPRPSVIGNAGARHDAVEHHLLVHVVAPQPPAKDVPAEKRFFHETSMQKERTKQELTPVGRVSDVPSWTPLVGSVSPSRCGNARTWSRAGSPQSTIERRRALWGPTRPGTKTAASDSPRYNSTTARRHARRVFFNNKSRQRSLK